MDDEGHGSDRALPADVREVNRTNCERWKPILEFDGRYDISDKGQIRNARNGYIIKPGTLPSGYRFVRIWKDGKKRMRYVHRLVADAFCVHPEGHDIVNHMDFNVQNNKAENLEWVTARGNIIYSMKRNRYHKFPSAKSIIGVKDGVEYLFQSVHEAAEKTQVPRKTIWRGRKSGEPKHGWLFMDAQEACDDSSERSDLAI